MAPAKPGRYHHGDLREALIQTAVELIAENGVRSFSLAAASRRLGVANSAPYAHFADRNALLAAVAVRSCEHFHTELESELGRSGTAAERLAGIARAYVRFAGRQRPLFEVLFSAGLDKSQHPEVAAAEKPLDDAFYASIGSLADGDVAREELAIAVEAAAHGYAMLLLDGSFDPSDDAIEAAAARAGRAVSALVESRRLLVRVNV